MTTTEVLKINKDLVLEVYLKKDNKIDYSKSFGKISFNHNNNDDEISLTVDGDIYLDLIDTPTTDKNETTIEVLLDKNRILKYVNIEEQ